MSCGVSRGHRGAARLATIATPAPGHRRPGGGHIIGGQAGAAEVREFYASLFGWTMQSAPQPYEGWMTDGGRPWRGVIASDTARATAGRWLPYILVEDLDAAAQRARRP